MFDRVVYRLRDGRVVAPGRLYRVRGGLWAEPAPSACPACGRQFGPDTVLVGSMGCRQAGGHHRLHVCTACGHVVYTPPITKDCEHPTTRSNTLSILPRTQAAGYGNAVTPPASEIIGCALVEAITGEDIERFVPAA